MDDKMLIEHLKDVHAKEDTSNFNVVDFLSAFGNPLDALAYSKLFWPDFIEFEGMIFFKDNIENDEDRSRIRAALANLGPAKEVEMSFNQFLIPEAFFSAHYSVANDEESLYLAEQMAAMWKARLAQLFPTKKCVVELQTADETLEGPTIVVYQE
ncbi:MAG: hypothetical protein ACRD59_05210 [Candidatus Acidiferrales bacterium]